LAAARPRSPSLERQQAGADRLAPPWPDLLVTCGGGRCRFRSRSAKPARARRSRFISRIPYGRPPIRPCRRPGPRPDRPASNVLKTVTAMHDVTAAKLAAAAARWEERLAPLGHPLLGVAIGGPTRRSRFTPRDARALARSLLSGAGGIWAGITPRGEHPQPFGCSWKRRSLAMRGYSSGSRGRESLPAILAKADRLVVTGDSVSMVSEAIATGSPVEVFDLGQGRHELFSTPSSSGVWQRGLAVRAEPTPPGRLRCDDPGGGRRQTPASGQALRRPYGL